MERPDEFYIRIIDIVRVIRRKRKIVLLTTVFAVIVAALVSFFSPRTYRIESTLVPVAGDSSSISAGVIGQLTGLGGLAGLLGDNDSVSEEAIAYLKGRDLVARFISRKNLIPTLFPEDARGRDSIMFSWMKGDEPTIWEAILKFDRDIRKVERERTTGLIKFSIDWEDRAQALEWNSELVRDANSWLRMRAISEAQANIAYLEEELKKTSIVEVRQAIFELLETQIKSAMVAEVRPEYAFRVIDSPLLPDANDYVRPRSFLIIVIGMVFGFIFGTIVSLYVDREYVFGAKNGQH